MFLKREGLSGREPHHYRTQDGKDGLGGAGGVDTTSNIKMKKEKKSV